MSENQSRFRAVLAEMSRGAKEQAINLSEKIRGMFRGQAPVVEARGELEASLATLNGDEQALMAEVATEISAENVEHIDLNEMMQRVWERFISRVSNVEMPRLRIDRLRPALLRLLVLAVFLASCAPIPGFIPVIGPMVPEVQATERVDQPVTIDKPTLAPTLNPTLAPTLAPAFTPTPTAKETSSDYLAKSENEFPLKVTEGLFDFYATADFDNIIYKDYQTPDGTVTKAWVIVEDGGQKFTVELLLDSPDSVYPLTSNGPTDKMGQQFPVSEAFTRNMIQRQLEILGLSGKARIQIVCGNNSGILFRDANPFPELFGGVNWDEALMAFANDGSYNKLPVISSISPHPVLYALRIQPVK